MLEADDNFYINAQIAGKGGICDCAPSPLYPTDNVPTETERVGGVTEAALRALEYGALVHEVIEHLPPLREKVVQPCFGTLQERMLVQRVLLPARAQQPAAKWVFRRLAAARCAAV